MRRILLGVALTTVFAMLCAGSALAAGTPVSIGTPFESGPPSVAVDQAGNAFVAWANTKDLAGAVDFVQYCVIPVNATACSHTGDLHPADAASHIDGITALVDGSTLVILADVYGASGANGTDPGTYEPDQEWQSTDGGATFTQVPTTGHSVSDGVLNADTQPLGAVALPGTGNLGFGYNTAGGSPPTFHAFPLTSPPDCTAAANGCPSGFATLEPASNPDQIGNAGGNFAANSTGVMGIFNTDFTNGPLGCSNAQTVPFGTAYVFGTGAQAAGTNDYNLSPGTAGSAWKVAATQLDCNVDYPAVGAGPNGFGVIENNELTRQTIYHRFDTATNSFDIPATVVSTTGEQQPAVNQDGGGGVYATYLSGGIGGPVSLSYSFDGGTTWSGPAPLGTSSGSAFGNLTSNVNGPGQGWAVWNDNGSVFAQSFQASDSVAPPAPTTLTTSQTAGLATGASISVPQGTIGETDQATIAGANAAHATGTISYALYPDSTCKAGTAVFTSGAQAVSGPLAPASSPVTNLLAPGKYYWQASYSGNGGSISGAVGNQPASSACGSEELAVGEPNTIASSAASDGTTVTITVSCAAVPCTITITLTATETVTVKASLARVSEKKKKTRKKTVKLGTERFTIKKQGPRKLKVKLSKTGKRFLAAHHGHVKLNLALAEKTAGGTVHTKRIVNVKLSKPKHHKKK